MWPAWGGGQAAPLQGTYTALINVYDRGRQFPRVLQAWAELRAQRVRPNAWVYTALISACRNEGAWQQALQFFIERRAVRGGGAKGERG